MNLALTRTYQTHILKMSAISPDSYAQSFTSICRTFSNETFLNKEFPFLKTFI